MPPYAVASRNVAAVIVTADLPGAVRAGDRFDVNVAAIGDARSLAGGTLLMTPLMANNKVAYAMAQGPARRGWLQVRAERHVGAEELPDRRHDSRRRDRRSARCEPELVQSTGALELLLDEPDYTTATRMVAAINAELPGSAATAVDSGRDARAR